MPQRYQSVLPCILVTAQQGLVDPEHRDTCVYAHHGSLLRDHCSADTLTSSELGGVLIPVEHMVSRGKGAVARPETTCKVLSEIPDLPGLKVCSESKSHEALILLVALSWLTELRWKSRLQGNQRSWRSADCKFKRCLASN